MTSCCSSGLISGNWASKSSAVGAFAGIISSQYRRNQPE